MDRAEISAIAHRWHPVAAPVSDENLARLVGRLDPPKGGRVLDLGCGFGEWLLAALEAFPDAEGVGIDSSAPALERARKSAADRTLSHRVTFEETDAAEYEGGEFDVVLCVGASHGLGGLTGFEPGFGHVSTPAEWDCYEWSWRGALATWALEDPEGRAEALETARTHRQEWLAGYRGQLGFVTLVLHDLGEDAAG